MSPDACKSEEGEVLVVAEAVAVAPGKECLDCCGSLSSRILEWRIRGVWTTSEMDDVA